MTSEIPKGNSYLSGRIPDKIPEISKESIKIFYEIQPPTYDSKVIIDLNLSKVIPELNLPNQYSSDFQSVHRTFNAAKKDSFELNCITFFALALSVALIGLSVLFADLNVNPFGIFCFWYLSSSVLGTIFTALHEDIQEKDNKYLPDKKELHIEQILHPPTFFCSMISNQFLIIPAIKIFMRESKLTDQIKSLRSKIFENHKLWKNYLATSGNHIKQKILNKIETLNDQKPLDMQLLFKFEQAKKELGSIISFYKDHELLAIESFYNKRYSKHKFVHFSKEMKIKLSKTFSKEGADYEERCPLTAKYFKALMNHDFEENESDEIEKWIFDLLMAVEEGDCQLLRERIDELDGGSIDNRLILLSAALLLAQEIEEKEKETILENALEEMFLEKVSGCQIEKNKEYGLPLLIRKGNEEKRFLQLQKNSFVLTVKTTALGTLFFASMLALNYLLRPEIPNGPRDGSGTPIPLCGRLDSWEKYENRITEAINSCPRTKVLGELANNASALANRPPWRIKIVPEGVILQGSSGDSNYYKGEIRILCDAQDPVSVAVFELENFVRQSSFIQAWEQSYNGKLGREDYVETVEKLEFDSGRAQISTLYQCRFYGWEPKKMWKAISEDNWPAWWKKIASGVHTENYRQDWDRAQKLRGISTSSLQNEK